MEIVGPACQIGHVEWHIELDESNFKASSFSIQYHKQYINIHNYNYIYIYIMKENLTVPVRWSRFTDAKRRRSLQQNLRIVVISHLSPPVCLEKCGLNFQETINSWQPDGPVHMIPFSSTLLHSVSDFKMDQKKKWIDFRSNFFITEFF